MAGLVTEAEIRSQQRSHDRGDETPAVEEANVRASSVVTDLEVVATEPLSREQAGPPVRLQIPQIGLTLQWSRWVGRW